MLHRGDHSAHDAPARRVTPAQVVGIGLVAASLAWAAWLLRDRPISEEVELLAGTILPSSEMAIVEAAFDRAQLTDHRTEGGRVWVPRQRQSAYMRALVDAEALPREFGSSLRRALEKNNPWQSRSVQEEMLRVAVQEELVHVICSMPGIERAAVLYDVDDRGAGGGLAAVPTRTASVNIRTQADVELEPARVQAIRVLVAAAIAGLEAEQVAVTDLRSGQVFAGPLTADAASAADPELARRIAHERHLTAKLRQALSFVRGAVVDVTVSFSPPVTARPSLPPMPPVPSGQQVAGANTPADVGAASPEPPPDPAEPELDDVGSDAPTTILVSLAVPEHCFSDGAAGGDSVTGGLTEDLLREHVLALVPPTRMPSGRRVVVTRYPDQPRGPRSAGESFAPGLDQPAPRSETETAVRPPVSLEGAWRAILSGQHAEVPREVWLGVIAVATAALGWLVLRPQSAGLAPSRPRRRPAAPADWAGIDPADAQETNPRLSERQVA
jgi:type III secretory pathway lipoprotein EscJ